MFPPNNVNTHTSELTQSMRQASMAQPPSPTNTVPVLIFANESSADAAAASEVAAIYTIKYEESDQE